MFMNSAVPMNVSRKPRIAYCVPIVTISEGACNAWTSKPLQMPRMAPLAAAMPRMGQMDRSGA